LKQLLFALSILSAAKPTRIYDDGRGFFLEEKQKISSFQLTENDRGFGQDLAE